MEYANILPDDEDMPCALEEKKLGPCPLCKYQDDNIVKKMNSVEMTLTGNVEPDEIYNVLSNMYQKHTLPLRRQGRVLLELTPELCKEHFTKHVVNPEQQVADDILYCCKVQRHYKKNIAVRASDTGMVTLNPHHVTEFVKVSKHKLELIKYYGTMRKKRADAASDEPYAFSN